MKKSELRNIIRKIIKEQLDDVGMPPQDQIDSSNIPPTGISVIAAACEDTPHVPGTSSVMHQHIMPTCLLGMSSVSVGDVVKLGTQVPYPASYNPNNIPHGQTGYVNTSLFTPVNQNVFITEVLGPCAYLNHGASLVMDNSLVNDRCQKCCNTINSDGYWLNGAPIANNNVPILASGACLSRCETRMPGNIQAKTAKPLEIDRMQDLANISKTAKPLEIDRMQDLANISKK